MTDAVSTLNTATSTGSSGTARVGLADNFETFLTLLTEQLKNQDPLEPLDSNEFVAQLVDFSSVEQQINQSDQLERLVSLQQGSATGAAVSYIGNDAVIDGATAPLENGEARWRYEITGAATSMSLAVEDASGRVVYSTSIEPEAGEQTFVWDGRDARGDALPPGAYTLSASALNAEDQALNVAVRAEGAITGVDFTGADPVLLLGAVRAPMDAVRSLTTSPNAS